MYSKFKLFCVLHLFLSQKTEMMWQNEMLLFTVVFSHDRLCRALPVSLSKVRLWDVCGRPCWPGRHWKMHNWQWTFNILYLGNERNSGQLGQIGGYLFFFFFFFCLGSVWVHPWKGVKKKVFTITTYLQLGWVSRECRLCVNIATIQWSGQLEQTQYVIME